MAVDSAGVMETDIQNLTGRKKINLMVLIVSMPVGGVETQVLSIIQRLNRERYNVTLCCIKESGELGEKAAASGIKTISLNLMDSNKFSLYIPWKIYRAVKENNIHILWTHQYVANLYGRLASLFVKVPVAPTFHVLYDNPKLHRSILNNLLSYKTDLMVSVSNAVAADMVRFDRVNPEKIKVIYNGIDENAFSSGLSKQEARKIFNLPPDGIIAGSIGRLSEQKGHRYLIAAVSKLKNACVAIAGEGPLMEELKSLSDSLKVKCIFTGKVGPEKIPAFLSALDVFCFPSLWEGFGIAIVEAMAAGLPVIVSDIPPHREVVGDAGVFVPPGNADALAEALNTIMKDPSIRGPLSAKAKERARFFSIEKTVKAYERLFEDLLK